MPDSEDITLLKEYAEGHEAAFTTLVERHVHLVYFTALRQVCNSSHAEEITQAVFIILAQKAKSLSPRMILSGWLYQTARLTAANFLRSEISRQQREQEVYMQSTLTKSDAAAWEQIAPLLEEAMGRLGETDRNAIVLRFFENKTAQEVATTLKLNEVVARKRVSRALEKLRKFFTKRGVSSTTAIIAGAISDNSVQTAPVALAKSVTAVAIVKGSIAATTTLTLVKGTLKIMTYAKLKIALGITAGILLVGGATTVVLSSGGAGDNPPPSEIFKNAQEKYASLTSYSDEGQTVSTVNGMTLTTTFTIKLARPNLYRIEWEQPVHPSYTNKGVVWSAGNGDFMVMGDRAVQNEGSRESALSSATGVSGSASGTIPGTFFKMNWGNQLGGSVSNEKRQDDERVGGVDCYVLTDEPKEGVTRTLWIGKQDFLIRQIRNVMSTEFMKAATAAAAERNPEIVAHLPNSVLQGVAMTQTHTNIVVNQKFSPADFAR